MSNTACEADESSYYNYTWHWTGIVSRGGLFIVGECPFLLLKAVEVQNKLFLPAYLGNAADIKQLGDKIFADKDFQYYWSMVAIDIESEEDYQELLQMLLERWITFGVMGLHQHGWKSTGGFKTLQRDPFKELFRIIQLKK